MKLFVSGLLMFFVLTSGINAQGFSDEYIETNLKYRGYNEYTFIATIDNIDFFLTSPSDIIAVHDIEYDAQVLNIMVDEDYTNEMKKHYVSARSGHEIYMKFKDFDKANTFYLRVLENAKNVSSYIASASGTAKISISNYVKDAVFKRDEYLNLELPMNRIFLEHKYRKELDAFAWKLNPIVQIDLYNREEGNSVKEAVKNGRKLGRNEDPRKKFERMVAERQKEKEAQISAHNREKEIERQKLAEKKRLEDEFLKSLKKSSKLQTYKYPASFWDELANGQTLRGLYTGRFDVIHDFYDKSEHMLMFHEALVLTSNYSNVKDYVILPFVEYHKYSQVISDPDYPYLYYNHEVKVSRRYSYDITEHSRIFYTDSNRNLSYGMRAFQKRVGANSKEWNQMLENCYRIYTNKPPLQKIE